MSEVSLKDKIDELRNINDKLSSALESAENRIDKAIEYINGESPDAGVSGNYIKKVLEGDK